MCPFYRKTAGTSIHKLTPVVLRCKNKNASACGGVEQLFGCLCFRILWRIAARPEMLAELAIAAHIIETHIMFRVSFNNDAVEERLEVLCQNRAPSTGDDHGINVPIIDP